MTEHISVLYEEILSGLKPEDGGLYVDGTFGAGGHTSGLLERSVPTGRVVAFDQDSEALSFGQKRIGEQAGRLILVHANFSQMGEEINRLGLGSVDGIVLDLGLSSRQLADGARGFSFQLEGGLDMRLDPTSGGVTAAELINNLSEAELSDLLRQYGEMPNSRRIATLLVANRPIETTQQLVALIGEKGGKRRKRIHPATLIFQALRIKVNDELVVLRSGLEQAFGLLKPGGRLAVISFHSLEDRIVKQYFRQLCQICDCPIEQPVCNCGRQAEGQLVGSRKGVVPTVEEMKQNPRSRSARLRIVEKLDKGI